MRCTAQNVRAITCLLVAAVLAIPSTAAEQARQPNIVVILIDDTGYSDIGVQGGTDIPTPNIDSIAQAGTRCTNGYVSCPYCSPTRAGLITGRYQQRFGHEFNEGVGRLPFGLPVTETTMADRLRTLGYATAAIGKWHLGRDSQFRARRRGFDEFYGTLGNTPFLHPQLVDSRIDGQPRRVEDPNFYTTDAYAARAVEFINGHADKPFFLYLPFNACHGPTQTLEKYTARFPNIADMPRRQYAAVLSALDDAVGAVLSTLRDKQLEEQTLVFFLSDNGGPMDKMGPNGSNNRPLKGQKGDTWEGAIRVPFFVQWKGVIPPGKVYAEPVISLDILPTAIAAAGGQPEPDWKLDGVDLLPYLTGKQTGPPHAALFWRFGTQWAVRMGNWKLVQGYDYAIAQPDPRPSMTKVTQPLLFDLAADIGEAHDLAAQQPEKVKELRTAWEAWNRENVEPAWSPQPRRR
ncbi:MAG: sulfatase-like hydrolase/transferase [Pirellulales bacterium]|nr:sulfatase-like hydrolase/transferase [Pirellulales bacterium]